MGMEDSSEAPGAPMLVPARMVNEYEYCPRLAYLEWVQSEWAESADTVDGRRVHRRVDRRGGRLPAAEEVDEDKRVHARSVTLASDELGLVAKLDLIEAEDGMVVPVDYKRGKRPHVAAGAYDPERVQLCAQGLLLQQHGYVCTHGVLFFVGSRERVRVVFDEELIALTTAALRGARALSQQTQAPPPLVDSPRCSGCSLVGICLPDEVNFLSVPDQMPRPLAVSAEPALPLHVQAYRGKVSKDGDRLAVSVGDAPATSVPIIDVSSLVIYGNVYVTTPTLHELMRRSIPVCWHGHGGWFMGHTMGTGHKNVDVRIAQFAAAASDSRRLAVARELVVGKIANARTLLRRNWKQGQAPEVTLDGMRADLRSAAEARDEASLLGHEGSAAARYFEAFSGMLNEAGLAGGFDFRKRNRRPATDPINALLSFAYAMLTRSFTVVLSAVGLDPYLGLYHRPRHGRPALALDMMEPFRPLIADSTVLQVINNGEIGKNDFEYSGTEVALTADARKALIAAFERRMDQQVTHPQFGYRLTYRRLLELECRLLARHLMGETPSYKSFRTR